MGTTSAITKTRHKRQQRNTTAKQVIALAKNWKFPQAQETAMYGRILSLRESLFGKYYYSIDEMGEAVKGNIVMPFLKPGHSGPGHISPRDLITLQRNIDERREAIVKVFMDAVDRHDGATIIELANAVWFFKDKRQRDFNPKDRERMVLIFLKLVSIGYTLTIREIAEFLAMQGMPKANSPAAAADGFSSLRRKCKELGIPIAASRKRKRE